MPKRRRENDNERLLKKIKKLEKKVRRRYRSRSNSPDVTVSQEPEYTVDSDTQEICGNVANLLDQNNVTELESGVAADGIDSAPTATSTAEPSTSAVVTDNIPMINACEDSVSTQLDDVILEILGEDPSVTNTYGTEINKELAKRLEHTAIHGLSKELCKELNDKFLIPSNCTLINAPALNAEIKAAISDINAKRDKHIELRQKQIATAISCLSTTINKLFTVKDANTELIKVLMDSARILCDSQYNDSITRRNFILSSLKKDMKDQLQSTKPDNLLFGQNLSETLKTAKAISKSGAELKVQTPKAPVANKKPSAATTVTSKNWKGPYPIRKPPNFPKTKEFHPNKNRQSNSSRHSQQQQPHSRR